jgi:ankyrin repeat protein
LKSFVDGVNMERFAAAAQAGDLDQVRQMLAARPELIGMDRSEGDEHRALHYAVLRRDVPMVRLLMQAGADARKGIWPHRDATSGLALAKDRGYADVVEVIEDEERRRRDAVLHEMSCPNATISPVQDQITVAIRRGEAAEAIRLMESDPGLIRACDRRGATPLHAAAHRGNVELVQWLLERRANVRKEDIDGLTPLDYAALTAGSYGSPPRHRAAEHFPAIAKLLIDHGAEITVRAAIALADVERVRQMVAAQPELLRKISGNGGLLTLAVNHGHYHIVELLLDLGADVDERIVLEEVEEPTPSWGMPLWHVALSGRLDIARLLLDRGADPNANVYASGWPLRNAWLSKHKDVEQLLIERGAKSHPYMAAEQHDVEAAKRLLAGPNNEEAARELAWSAGDHGCAAIVELALPHVPIPLDDRGWHWILIQPIRGAGPDSAGNEGHFQAMAALLRFGVNPNVRRFGATALHFAAAHQGPIGDEDRARFAAMLLDHGARLDLRDDLLHSTALGWACRWGRTAMVKLIIHYTRARGASIDEPDAEPWATPKAWAEKMARLDILQLLHA